MTGKWKKRLMKGFNMSKSSSSSSSSSGSSSGSETDDRQDYEPSPVLIREPQAVRLDFCLSKQSILCCMIDHDVEFKSKELVVS